MGKPFETDFIAETAGQTPFANMPARHFFVEWCRIHDSIVPEFLTREAWEQRGMRGILEKHAQGKLTLFLPHDLHLWEMMDVIRAVDHDTLSRSPEKRGERADRINALGEMFEKAGFYLSEYLPDFCTDEGKAKQIAEKLAHEFAQYGLSLQGEAQNRSDIPQRSPFSQEDKTKLDEWFLGRGAYEKRLARLDENSAEQERESVRRKLLLVYFNALAREGFTADGETPWEKKVGPMQHLQDRTRRQITIAVETPKRDLHTSVFRRGSKTLATDMTEPTDSKWEKAVNAFLRKLGFDPLLKGRKLYAVLQIDALKKELAAVRASDNLGDIADKELAIAKEICSAVCKFPAENTAYNPDEMIRMQGANCLGLATLGGAFLDELEIAYLVANLPEHVATVLITSDGKTYWQDFTLRGAQFKVNYTELTTDMFVDGPSLENAVKDSALTLTFKSFNPYSHVLGLLKIDLVPPEIGLQNSTLYSLGGTLSDLGRYDEAIEAYEKAIQIDPTHPYPYNGLGNALSDLGRYDEAIEAYEKAIQIAPTDAVPYSGLGNTLSDLGRYDEAIKAYEKAIQIAPTDAILYSGLGNTLSDLGRYDEAIEAYEKAIQIDPTQPNPYYWLCGALKALGRYDEATEANKKFIGFTVRGFIKKVIRVG